jgi:DNA-binding LacI/PurR family transcriptional regulator
MEDKALVDVYVYNYDIAKFELIILSHLTEYDHYLVIPYFRSQQNYSKATELLNRLMDHQLILMDNFIKGIKPAYSSVSQNFELDIREALISLNDHLSKYKKHFLIHSKDSAHPAEVMKGFSIYCKMHDYDSNVVQRLEPDLVQDQNNYVLLDDEDLVRFIEITRQKKLELGKQVGLISYNETHLKKILAGGITVISTDWEAIGKTAAELILQKKTDHIVIPYKVYLRNSII